MLHLQLLKVSFVPPTRKHLRVSFHHLPGVGGGLGEALPEGEHLAGHAQRTQPVQVSVRQDALLLFQALVAQLDYLSEVKMN